MAFMAKPKPKHEDGEAQDRPYDEMTFEELNALMRQHIENAERALAEERRQREELDHLRRVYGVPLFRW
jgi:hypothetical protein